MCRYNSFSVCTHTHTHTYLLQRVVQWTILQNIYHYSCPVVQILLVVGILTAVCCCCFNLHVLTVDIGGGADAPLGAVLILLLQQRETDSVAGIIAVACCHFGIG